MTAKERRKRAATGSPADSRLPGARTSCAYGVRSSGWVFGDFLFDRMDAGGRAPTVGALGGAGAVAEAIQKKVIRLRERDSNNRRINDTLN
jgi:hypothetical protein